jgi:hypothetical protein
MHLYALPKKIKPFLVGLLFCFVSSAVFSQQITITGKVSSGDSALAMVFKISHGIYQPLMHTPMFVLCIEKNTTTKTLELARLYIGPNLIVDQNNNFANAQAAASAITLGQPVTLNVTIPASLANEAYIFASVGVKTNGVAELLYTQSQKLQLK